MDTPRATVTETRSGPMVEVTIRCQRRSTLLAAQESYRERYPPAGYSTCFGPLELGEDGLWTVRGTRNSSCE